MVAEGLAHTDPVHDAVGWSCKMAVDIVEKNNVDRSRSIFMGHDFGSSIPRLASCHVHGSSCCAGSILLVVVIDLLGPY